MIGLRFENIYTRIDPDGTIHRWENRVELMGPLNEVRLVLGDLTKRAGLPSTKPKSLLNDFNYNLLDE